MHSFHIVVSFIRSVGERTALALLTFCTICYVQVSASCGLSFFALLSSFTFSLQFCWLIHFHFHSHFLFRCLSSLGSFGSGLFADRLAKQPKWLAVDGVRLSVGECLSTVCVCACVCLRSARQALAALPLRHRRMHKTETEKAIDINER